MNNNSAEGGARSINANSKVTTDVTEEAFPSPAGDRDPLKRQAALAALRLSLNPNGCAINCLIEPTRTGAGAWIKVFTVSLLQEEPSLENITYPVGVATGIPMAEKDGSYRLFLKGCGFNRAQHVADAVNAAMYYTEGSIKGRSL